MTKLEQIRRQAAGVHFMTYPIAVAVIAFLVYCQYGRVPLTKEFWVTIYIALGCCGVFFVGLFWHRIRCPDCGRSVAFACRDKNPQKCPHCGTDWTAESQSS